MKGGQTFPHTFPNMNKYFSTSASVLCVALIAGAICYKYNTGQEQAPPPPDSSASSEITSSPDTSPSPEVTNTTAGPSVPEPTNPAPVQPVVDEETQKKIVQQYNQIIWVTSGIREYNDVCVLEDAEALLSESYLNIELFNDENLIDMVTQLRTLITQMRIDEGNREILEQETAKQRANAIWDAISGINANGMNPASCLMSLATSSAQSVANYERVQAAIAVECNRKTWELDKALLSDLNEWQNGLLRIVAVLSRENKFPDGWRLSIADATALIEQLKGKSPDDVLHYLRAKSTQTKYAELPEYWYHRGIREQRKANELMQAHPKQAQQYEKDARSSFERYQRMYMPFRRSRDAVMVAMGMIQILSKEYEQLPPHSSKDVVKAQIKKQIQYIEQFSDSSDLATTWQDQYAIYLAYKMIGEREMALITLHSLSAALRNASSSIVEMTLSKRPPKGKPMNIRAFMMPLAVCDRALREEIGGEAQTNKTDIASIMENIYQANQTKLEMIGTVSKEKQEQYIRQIIKGATWRLDEDNNTIICRVPWAFFVLEDIKCDLKYVIDREEGERDCRVETIEKREYITTNGKIEFAELYFEIPGAHDVTELDYSFQLDLLHPRMPVGLVFTYETPTPVAVRYGKKTGTAPGARVEEYEHWFSLKK